MEIIVYYLFCLLARKKIILNVSYFIGTLAFVSLSYNTANTLTKVPLGAQLSKIPLGIQLSLPGSSINQSQIVNTSSKYEERIQYLRNQCGSNNNPSLQTLQTLIRFDRQQILSHLGFVVQSHSLFYCSVPKVATRTLLPYITYLYIRDELMNASINNSRNTFDADYLNGMLSTSIKNDPVSLLSLFLSRLMMSMKVNSSKLDLWAMYQKKALPLIRLRALSNPLSLFSNSSTRAIFVRHPLERLASAYVDKIGTLSSEPFSLYDDLRRSICRKYAAYYLTAMEQHDYRHNRMLRRQINEPCEKVIPSFEHFVEYIMSDSSQADVHWKPYSTLCHVCTFKYNFIGRYETIQDDLNYFRSKFSLNSNDSSINNHFSTGKSKEYYKSMYSKLSNDLICNLKHFYNDDVRLFNYHFEDYLANNQNIHCPFKYYRRFDNNAHL